ncbi:MAG: hypothetical protein AAGE99_03850 [Chlamydiota bacterium]
MLDRNQAKKKALYQSYQLAHERLLEETGFLYPHLTKTKELNRTVLLKISEQIFCRQSGKLVRPISGKTI